MHIYIHIAHKVLICVSKFSVKRAKIGKRTAGLFGIQCATRHYTNKNKFFLLYMKNKRQKKTTVSILLFF